LTFVEKPAPFVIPEKKYYLWSADMSTFTSTSVHPNIVAPKLACSTELPSPYGRGLIVVGDVPLETGEVALSVPEDCLLSIKSPFLSEADAPLQSFLQSEAAKGMVEDDILSLRLLHEMRVNRDVSKFAGLISLLPKSYDLPFDFDDDELAAYEGTGLHPVAKAMKEQAREDFYALVSRLQRDSSGSGKKVLEDVQLDEKSFIWALSTIWSRGISLPLGPSETLFKALAPFFDLSNHHPLSLHKHMFDQQKRALVIKASSTVEPGQQLLINYGLHFSRDMIKLRGFVTLPSNINHSLGELLPADHESVQIQVAVPPTNAERSQLLLLYPPQNPHAITKAEKEEAGTLSVLPDGTVVATFELYEGAYNAALHRVLSILMCKQEGLSSLKEALVKDRYANYDVQSELDTCNAVGEAIAGLHEALGYPSAVEAESLLELENASRGDANSVIAAAAAAVGNDDRIDRRRRRLQCAFYLRSVERKILKSQMNLISGLIADLRGLVESFSSSIPKETASTT
jgi:hypothetical protein